MGTEQPQPNAVTSGAEPDRAIPKEAPPPTPWEVFISGKAQSAEKFLRIVQKQAILLPDDAALKSFADAIVAKPKKIARLISLLQAAASARDTLRHIAVQLAESTIRGLRLITISEPFGSEEFINTVGSWLGRIPKKPLSGARLNELWLLLHFGSLRQLLETEVAYKFVKAATSPAKKKKPNGGISTPDALAVLLAASPSRPVLVPLISQFEATHRSIDRLQQDLATQATEINRLSDAISDLKGTISRLRDELATAKRQKDQDDARVSDLEQQIVELQDGYQHKLDALRARIRGVLEGQLTRWLQTAVDASRADPPFMQAIEERLEDALKLIQREAKWLQPSA